ncbi:iron-sulfur cluster assembly accessory protein [Paenibacillus albus]|uniref:Iron-sulfur cluster assembly accessory protein n=1 Tax=Paenibacillus albus TaxID=2495582 RepID=A0A3S9A9A1_9BACL|nr:iron-sulfur cluster assembly accessory protein [Paenibacillus albus]AZN42338.1 iron-sulfur cluster assembly accessory protein [Paenibacillus albus]
MNCKITRNAAKVLREEIDKPENEGKLLRVFITHSHGDHAHYGMQMDEPTEKDEIVETDKDIKVLLEKGVELLDGVRIDYFYVPEEGFAISNPTKGNHGDH